MEKGLVWGQLTVTNHPDHLDPLFGRGLLGGRQRLDGHRRSDGPMIYSNRGISKCTHSLSLSSVWGYIPAAQPHRGDPQQAQPEHAANHESGYLQSFTGGDGGGSCSGNSGGISHCRSNSRGDSGGYERHCDALEGRMESMEYV